MNSLYLKEGWLFPSIALFVFFFGVFAYLFKKYRTPSIFFSSAIVFGVVNSLAIYFFLNSQLSLIGVSAFILSIFYSLFLSFYLLSFVRNLFEFEFLDRKNIWSSFKRGLVFSSDLTIPLFIFSTFIAFLAPIHLREFGIVLSLCTVLMFLFIPIFANFLVLNYVDRKFLKIRELYKSLSVKKDCFLSKLISLSAKNKFLFCFGILCALFISAFIVYGLYGFNSFSFLKNNYLLIVSTDNANLVSGKSKSDVESALKIDAILVGQSGVSAKKFATASSDSINLIFSGPLNVETLKSTLKEVVNESGFSIQSVGSFNDWFTLSDLLISFSFGLLLLSVYVLIRFKFKSFFIFVFNTLLSSLVFFSIVVVGRISLYSSFFLSVCSFLTMIIMYHMCWFNILHSSSNLEWFRSISDNVYSSVYLSLRHVIFWFLIVSIFAMKEEVITINLYMILAIASVHFVSTYVYYSLISAINLFMDRFIYKKHLVVKSDSSELINLDLYDEELVPGINTK